MVRGTRALYIFYNILYKNQPLASRTMGRSADHRGPVGRCTSECWKGNTDMRSLRPLIAARAKLPPKAKRAPFVGKKAVAKKCCACGCRVCRLAARQAICGCDSRRACRAVSDSDVAATEPGRVQAAGACCEGCDQAGRGSQKMHHALFTIDFSPPGGTMPDAIQILTGGFKPTMKLMFD
jgi:hypothetical protein